MSDADAARNALISALQEKRPVKDASTTGVSQLKPTSLEMVGRMKRIAFDLLERLHEGCEGEPEALRDLIGSRETLTGAMLKLTQALLKLVEAERELEKKAAEEEGEEKDTHTLLTEQDIAFLREYLHRQDMIAENETDG